MFTFANFYSFLLAALLVLVPVIMSEDLDGTLHWGHIPVPDADMAFEYFFRYGSYGVPEGVEVLGVTFDDGHLILDVCEKILSYGGGSAFELALVAQLEKIAVEVFGAERFNLLIDGEGQSLIYGTIPCVAS